ncbi:hypothetical protein GGI35DRAFT_488232 [Trichoderma velutinum]
MEFSNNVEQDKEGQTSISRDDGGNSDSDTQSISLSDSSDEHFAKASEIKFESDDDSNNEEDSDAMDDLEEGEPSVLINTQAAWIERVENLLDSTLNNDSFLRAVFSIISSDTAELWAFGKTKFQNVDNGWPQFNAQLRQIHIREYGRGFCTSEIHQGARQLLAVGGTIHYMQASIEASNNSSYDSFYSEIEQGHHIPTGFHFIKVFSFSKEEVGVAAVDFGISQTLSPLRDNGSKDWVVKVICSAWRKNEEIPEHELIKLTPGDFYN